MLAYYAYEVYNYKTSPQVFLKHLAFGKKALIMELF